MGWWLIGAEVILILTAFGGCCGGLITVWCQQQRKSRCSRLSICCGCIKCDRTIESDELMIAEEALENKKAVPPPRERSASLDEPVPPEAGQI